MLLLGRLFPWVVSIVSFGTLLVKEDGTTINVQKGGTLNQSTPGDPGVIMARGFVMIAAGSALVWFLWKKVF